MNKSTPFLFCNPAVDSTIISVNFAINLIHSAADLNWIHSKINSFHSFLNSWGTWPAEKQRVRKISPIILITWGGIPGGGEYNNIFVCYNNINTYLNSKKKALFATSLFFMHTSETWSKMWHIFLLQKPVHAHISHGWLTVCYVNVSIFERTNKNLFRINFWVLKIPYRHSFQPFSLQYIFLAIVYKWDKSLFFAR